MKTTPSTSPQAAQDAARTLRLELPTQSRDPSNWLWNLNSDQGPKHPAHTDVLAQRVVQASVPNGRLTGLKPGFAGLASYRVDAPGGVVRHLKIAIPPLADVASDSEHIARYAQLRRSAALEAQRATWAGEMGVGPKVYHIDAEEGAFISDFVAGSTPSFDVAQTTLRPGYLSALATLHSRPLDRLPEDGPRNWFFEHRAQSLMAEAKKPQPQALQHAVGQLEAGLESYFAKTAYPTVAIHDDLHPLNSLADNGQVVLIDWNNLRRGDAAIDVGHLSAMLDWAMPDMGHVVQEYRASAVGLGQGVASGDTSLLSRTQAYTAYFRLRGFTFFDQWDGTKPISNYLRQRMAEDVEALGPSVLRELDLRPDASVRQG